jgi:hypothetical protein
MGERCREHDTVGRLSEPQLAFSELARTTTDLFRTRIAAEMENGFVPLGGGLCRTQARRRAQGSDRDLRVSA